MEKDDEVKGNGNSYDFGARMYDSRLGRFLSLDAHAAKFAFQSPYSYAGNMPIWAKDVNGDSVLFYSQSGNYLGYSYDNHRYKDQNLLVIIDDGQVKKFTYEYNRKRSDQYKSGNNLSNTQIEAHVAGLEAMGTTFDVTQLIGFVKKYSNLVGPDKDHTSPAEQKINAQQEWGADLVRSKDPNKPNWITVDENSIRTDELNNHVEIVHGDNSVGDIHLHTADLREAPSKDDLRANAKTVFNTNGRSKIFFVGQINSRDGKWTLYTKIAQTIPTRSGEPITVSDIFIDNESFKKPGQQ